MAGLLQNIAHGVNRHTVKAHFVVQVRPCGAATHAHIAHNFAALDPLAFLHGATLHVPVFGHDTAAVEP